MSTVPEFDVTHESPSPDVLVVGVVGDLDMASCPRVETILASAPAGGRVLVDLTGCTFIDSAGVRMLMAAHRAVTAESGRVELVAADPSILRVLEITEVSTMMPVHSTLATAL